MSDPEKKIIIDEDWKTQVEREREELESKSDEASGNDTSSMGDIPPASLSMLVTSIATQAMMALPSCAAVPGTKRDGSSA